MDRKKIAILGGGVGGLCTAYELTSRPNWYQHYEITIYQMGWRLGGKGASGRDALNHQRIEEHGLHIWWGFYDHALRMMRGCYDELQAPPMSFGDAFLPLNHVPFMEEVEGRWYHRALQFFPNELKPGQGTERDGVLAFVKAVVHWIWQRFTALPDKSRAQVFSEQLAPLTAQAASILGGYQAQAAKTQSTEAVQLSGEQGLESANQLVEGLELSPLGDGFLMPRLRALRDVLMGVVLPSLRKPAPARIQCEEDYEERWFFLWATLGCVAATGLLKDVVLPGRTLDELDCHEFRDWLRLHGMDDETLQSVLIRTLYDAAFCFTGGDSAKPDVAAGVILRAACRMLFTYKGAFMWKMAGSMGDVVFAPLYRLLEQRASHADRERGMAGSLRFKFFHRVRQLLPSDAGEVIDEIRIGVQATVKGDKYEPLLPRSESSIEAWPNRPLYAQLLEGPQLAAGDGAGAHNLESYWCAWPDVDTVTLRRGRDFDIAVLAIPIGALPQLCASLVNPLPAASPARKNAAQSWREMFAQVKTVRTQAFQLWLTSSLQQLGFASNEPGVLAGYRDPFNSWADMSHVLRIERWPQGEVPKALVYLCGPMPEDPHEPDAPNASYARSQHLIAKNNARQWLDSSFAPLWPRAARMTGSSAGSFDWSVLAAPAEAVGEARLDHQYFRANTDPSERYVLSVAGSTRYRLFPGQSGFANLFLAGDWTRNDINLGCVEAATQSGIQAAQALISRLQLPSARVPVQQPMVQLRPMDAAQLAAPDRNAYLPMHAQVLAPPYELRGVTVQYFPLRADHDRLESLCARFLNSVDSDIQFRALFGLAFLQISRTERCVSLAQPDQGFGSCSEDCAALFVPVVRGRQLGGLFMPLDIGLFVPYIFVDNGLSLLAGREVFGIPKELAEFDFRSVPAQQQGTAQPAWNRVQVSALSSATLGASARFQKLPLITVESLPAELTPQSALPIWDNPTAALAQLLPGLYGDTVLPMAAWSPLTMLRDWLGFGAVSLFSVKQFRDSEQPAHACYRTITRAVMKIVGPLHGGRLPGSYRVTMPANASHAIAATLGIQETSEPLWPFWLQGDSLLYTGSSPLLP